jgi:hypothetical protein
MYRGRPRASSNVRHRYSPSTPNTVRIIPCPISSTVMSAAKPVPATTHPNARPAMTIAAYANPNAAIVSPMYDIARIGT